MGERRWARNNNGRGISKGEQQRARSSNKQGTTIGKHKHEQSCVNMSSHA